jgi:NAD-dependent dihydropyrimidine dehydrogenase PreA subunit/membrane protein implicated in regulation of membrane protease activity
MKRAQLNFAVDAVIAVAFLVCALTGILFLLPPGVIRALGLGMPGMLGLPFHAWHWLHDWSGVLATVGVLVHAALHYRWIATMTRRTFGSQQTPARRGSRVPVAAPAGRAASSAGATPAGAAAGGYSTYRADAARRRDQRRITRRRFLAGAAAGLGVAVLGGGVLSRLSATAADAQQGSNGSHASDGGATQSGSGTTSQSAAGSAQSSGSSTSSAGATGSGASSTGGSSGSPGSAAQSSSTAATLVSVDTSECIGCGRCLNVCPAGVFAWDSSGNHAVARNAAQCIRCHRCLQTCPASAITVNG